MSSEQSSSSGFQLEGFDDVEDYIPDVDENGFLVPSYKPNKGNVFDLVQNANQAFRENRFEEAITSYSKANFVKPLDHAILSNRSVSYIRLSQCQRQKPPSASESYFSLARLDMTTLAELALKDAEKLESLVNNSVKPYILKAGALILLGRYDVARDAVLSGLQIDPQCIPLKTNLDFLERATASMTSRRLEKAERTGDFDCRICLNLLYEPVTTSCGHSFCRPCIIRSMDRGNRCPLCRTVLFINLRNCVVSGTLNNIIQKNFPEEYAERKSEHGRLINLADDLLPIFVMYAAIPCQKFRLLMCEPRYRLLVRRAMEGNHRMGMVTTDPVITDPTTGFTTAYACEVEITDCVQLPDGNYELEIESRRRCRMLNCSNEDAGYIIAKVEWIGDIPPKDDKEREDLQKLTNNAAEVARLWLITAKKETRHDGLEILKIYADESMMPGVDDPELFSFWLATPSYTTTRDRMALLRMRDTAERIRRGLVFLRREERERRGLGFLGLLRILGFY